MILVWVEILVRKLCVLDAPHNVKDLVANYDIFALALIAQCPPVQTN